MTALWYNYLVLQDSEKNIKSNQLRPFVQVLQDLSTAAVVFYGGLAMIYFISDEAREFVKIGYTGSTDANGRLSAIQVGSINQLEIIHTMPGNETEEKRLHTLFSKSSERGEWFRINLEIAIFLELPVDDQIRLSKTDYGNTFMEALIQVFLMQEGNEELMFLRWMGLSPFIPKDDFNRAMFPKTCPMNIADELFKSTLDRVATLIKE
jgi:hypothetical protein